MKAPAATGAWRGGSRKRVRPLRCCFFDLLFFAAPLRLALLAAVAGGVAAVFACLLLLALGPRGALVAASALPLPAFAADDAVVFLPVFLLPSSLAPLVALSPLSDPPSSSLPSLALLPPLLLARSRPDRVVPANPSASLPPLTRLPLPPFAAV